MTIGVLALQGDYAAHAQVLQACGASGVLPVRDAEALEKCDGLIIPGGESTTMSRLCDRYGLWQPLRERIGAGLPVFGTCAGLIMLSKNISGGSRNFAQKTLGALDIDVARNAYGPQIESFETELKVPVLGEEPLRVAFIRAPQITRVGEGVEVLARHGEQPVAVRENKIVALAFHPEVVGEARLHQYWLDLISSEINTTGDMA
jgi:5'-phosphate synthase pdxT subunit